MDKRDKVAIDKIKNWLQTENCTVLICCHSSLKEIAEDMAASHRKLEVAIDDHLYTDRFVFLKKCPTNQIVDIYSHIF